MRIIEEYLFYIQEDADDPRIKDKKEQLKTLNKQYSLKLSKCRQREEPGKTSCVNGLAGMKKKINQMNTDIHPKIAGAIDTIGQAGAKIAGFSQKYSTLATYAAGAAGVALAVAAAIKIYNRFFSQAAKSCVDAKNKTECMKKFKIQALQRAKSEIARGKAKCNQTKDPKKCVEKMNKQLQNYDDKISSIKS